MNHLNMVVRENMRLCCFAVDASQEEIRFFQCAYEYLISCKFL